MKSKIFILFAILLNFKILHSNIINCDTKPNQNFKKIKSIIIYPFDGKLINSGEYILLDFVKISDDFHKYFLKNLQSFNEIETIDGKEIIKTSEGDNLAYQRGKKIPEYDEKSFNFSQNVSLESVKTAEASLYGKIIKFYRGENFEMSYIEIIFYLVDTESKVILWTSKISGCLKYVVETIIKTIISGEYSEPTIKDIKSFKWENPYEKRFKYLAIEYRIGYFIPTYNIESGFGHIIGFYFKLPFLYKTEIYNKISLGIIPSLNSNGDENSLKKYEYNTYLPLFFDFIYNFNKYIKFLSINKQKNFLILSKIGLGIGFYKQYYSGTGKEIEGNSITTGCFGFGLGTEYFLDLGVINLGKFYLKAKRIGFNFSLDYYKWFANISASNFINLSLGLKYYF